MPYSVNIVIFSWEPFCSYPVLDSELILTGGSYRRKFCMEETLNHFMTVDQSMLFCRLWRWFYKCSSTSVERSDSSGALELQEHRISLFPISQERNKRSSCNWISQLTQPCSQNKKGLSDIKCWRVVRQWYRHMAPVARCLCLSVLQNCRSWPGWLETGS